MLINCAMQMTMCLFAHQKADRQVWIFSQYYLKRWQNCKRTSLSRSLQECTIGNLYGWRFRLLSRMSQTLLADVPDACAFLNADRLGLRLTDASTRAMFWWRPTRWLSTRDRAFFTTPPYPMTDCIWRWGLMSIHFMAKSTPRLYNGPLQNIQFHSTHTFCESPEFHVE